MKKKKFIRFAVEFTSFCISFNTTQYIKNYLEIDDSKIFSIETVLLVLIMGIQFAIIDAILFKIIDKLIKSKTK